MNAKIFSDALGELDSRYIEEAVSYSPRLNSARRFRRLPLALIAAVLAVLLMGAGVVAAIYGDSIQNWFGHYWESVTGQQMSREQAAIIDRLSQDIGLEQTVGDVTVTVDSATVGYDNFFLLLRVKGVAFSKRYAYGFEQVELNVDPDPIGAGGGISGYGFQWLGVDGDGSVLLLLEHSYASKTDQARDTSPVHITLTMENLLQSPNMKDREKLVAAGEWSFTFSLDRSKEIEMVRLPDTEVTATDLDRREPVSIVIRNVELTSTGLRFQYDCGGGTLSIDPHIDVVLKNGGSISVGGGSGTSLEDGKTMNCSYQWLVPFHLEEAVCIQIDETQILIP